MNNFSEFKISSSIISALDKENILEPTPIQKESIPLFLEGYDLIKDDPSLESDICITFLLKYIVYSIEITQNICDDLHYCDNAMADGFNWLNGQGSRLCRRSGDALPSHQIYH